MTKREQAARRRAARVALGDLCAEPECGNVRHGTDGLCKTHHNRATGHGWDAHTPDPEKRRASWRTKNYRRRARLRIGVDVTPEYERALRAKARRCPLCTVRMVGRPFTAASKELDHIVPINVGGTHTIGNVRIICRACNEKRPKDGSDYTGAVTLWATDPEAIQPPSVRRAKQRPACDCGELLRYGRCLSCQPRPTPRPRPTHCQGCKSPLPTEGGQGRPRKYCAQCRPSTYFAALGTRSRNAA